MEIEISGDGTNDAVFVDVNQITQSISHILTNALQSYKGGNGPVSMVCDTMPDGKTVAVAMRDSGCGMDAETVARATDPFFSAPPAGRRRGMGLAHTQRLLSLNGGDLKLTSQPTAGTTVIITLPKV